MDHSQRVGNNDSSNNSALSNSMPNVLFREIHKNAFLKRHTSDRRTGFPKKSEKVWVVFCVHDDVEPFLEIYPDQKVALTHKPEWFASLSSALHISPSICGHEDEFEFAVTLSFQVVRLAAPSWESMMEWVETIRNKLRELKILCPKENVYSKMPEPKQFLFPTRDPNSPLPLPPEGPSTLLPGVELVHLEPRNASELNENNDLSRGQRDNLSRSNLIPERQINQKRGAEKDKRLNAQDSTAAPKIPSSSSSSENSQNFNAPHSSTSSSNSEIHKIKPRSKRAATVPPAEPSTSEFASCSNITIIKVPSTSNSTNNSTSDCINSSTLDIDSDDENVEDVFILHPNEKILAKPSPAVSKDEDTHYEHIFLPIVPSIRPQISHSSNMPSTSQNISKVKKPHSNSIMITSNASNFIGTSQGKNSVSSTININSDVPKGVSSDPNFNKNLADENGIVLFSQQQNQKVLEKGNVSKMIPRLPAKSVKVVVSTSIPSSSRESNLNDTSKQQDVPSVAEEQNNSNFPPYSQVKKIPKEKVKNHDSKTEEGSKNQNGSPLCLKRKISNLRIGEIDGSHKSENHLDNNSSQGSSITSKSHNVITNAQKILINKTGNKNKNPLPNPLQVQPSTSTSNSEQKNEIPNPGPSVAIKPKTESPCTSNNNFETEPLDATIQPSVRVVNVEDIPLIGGHQRRRRRSSSSEAAPPVSASSSSRVIGGADRIRINVPVTPNYTSRDFDKRLPPQTKSVNEINVHPLTKLTLREQQVLRLRKEILHPGGVRVQLRKVDCIGAIAFVEALNRVWVAGWNQKEHPILYHSLHIGDELISIDNVLVRNNLEAQTLVTHALDSIVEFIIRRVPFGNVFLLQRSSDGQNLGIVQEGNTAEIKEIVPNSIAAKHGLTSKTPSSDGLSLTTWFITEINGRPLNLFFKNNEVRDRLNAVGREISILVQPYDFIKKIKKELKSFDRYKAFTVQ